MKERSQNMNEKLSRIFLLIILPTVLLLKGCAALIDNPEVDKIAVDVVETVEQDIENDLKPAPNSASAEVRN